MKTIDYRLTSAEKDVLKASKISIKSLRDYAPDEIAAVLGANWERGLKALAEFQRIPSLGVGFASELIAQGYYLLEDLKGKTGIELYDAYEKFCGTWADQCVEDSYRLLTHYIENRDDSKRWWNFTAERKAYREKFGFPVDRPLKPWYELPQYNSMKNFKAAEIRA
jgi:hypothetical protein